MDNKVEGQNRKRMDFIKTSETKKKWNTFLYFSVVTANLSSFTLGLGYTWSSPAIPRLNGQIDLGDNPLSYNITPYQESWIASLVALGSAVSAFISGYLASRIGRKYTLLASTIPTISGYLFLIFCTNITHIYIGRLLIGLGCGPAFTVVPIYVGEISEKSNRGALGCLFTVLVTAGCLFVFILAPYVTLKTLSCLCLISPAIFLLLFGVFAPESPYYYVQRNKIGSAEMALLKFRCNNSKIVREELLIIIRDVENSFAKKMSIKELSKDKAIMRGSLIAILLLCFQQWSGINTVYFYLQSIFEESASGISSDLSAIIVGLVQFSFSLSTLYFADKYGRIPLLLISTISMGLSLCATGIYFHLKEYTNYNVDSVAWLPVITLNLLFAAYNIGLGPVTCSMIGELFPPHTKTLATTLSIFFCLLSTFLSTTAFPYVRALIGLGLSFVSLGVICFLAFMFVFFVVPETKGKSLQEVQEFLRT